MPLLKRLLLPAPKPGEKTREWPPYRASAVLDLDPASIDPQACMENAARFGLEQFRAELPRQVEAAIADAGAEGREERRAARAGGRAGGLRLRRRLG